MGYRLSHFSNQSDIKLYNFKTVIQGDFFCNLSS